MKLSKNIAMLTLGSSALALTALAAPRLDDSIRELNDIVVGILAPYQTAASKAVVEFKTLVTDDANLLKLNIVGNYERTGKVQTMTIDLRELSFDYADGKPAAVAVGYAGVDLTKLFQQDQLNGLVDSAEGMVLDLVKNYTKAYGDAVALEAKMLEKTKDDAGNYTAFKARVTAQLDYSKLPPNKKAEDIALLAAELNFSVVLAKGIDLSATVALNPDYKGFKGDAASNPKALFEKLLTRDAPSMKKIDDVIKKLDGMAANIVDAQVK